MKIAASILNNTNTKAANKIVLPLVPDKATGAPSDQKVAHTLYSDPENPADSPKCKDARELIAWRKAVNIPPLFLELGRV